MKCNEIFLETVPFCCDDLDEEKAKEFKRHTTICKECARYYFRIRKTLQYIRNNVPEMETIELNVEKQTNR